MSEFLYHYTSKQHLQQIIESGYLKLTPSNLIEPTDLKIITDKNGDKIAVSELSDPVKPVVWLTESTSPERMGIDNTKFDKKQIRITIPKKSTYKLWFTWAQRNKIKKSWYNRLIKDCNYTSWYISEDIIKLEDIAKIEDLKTGDIIHIQEVQ